MVRTPAHARRNGFTLTEMLVASALIIFMMWILSSAFEKGLNTFSQLKNAGDMQEKLRAAATVIRQDLISPHFAGGDVQHSNDSEFVSGQKMINTEWQPPSQGYFRIFQEGTSIDDGRDPDDASGTLIHKRSPAIAANSRGHVMQFTVKQKGDRRDRYFMIDPQDSNATTDGRLHSLSVPTYNVRRQNYYKIPGSPIGLEPEFPSSVFTTTWAEITYFVRPNGSTTGGIPLYSLYRRQSLLATELGAPVTVQVPANDPKYLEVSAWATTNPNWPVNSQKTITAPSRRLGVDPAAAASSVRAGRYKNQIPRIEDEAAITSAMVASDLLLTDITDFEIKVMWDSAAASGSVPAPQTPQPAANPDFPFDQLPAGNNPALTGARVFDTWSRHRSSSASDLDDYGTESTGVTPATEAWNRGYVTTTPAQSPDERSIPVKIRVRAIQIELRIWDVKSKQSRQITIIQDL